MRLLMAFVCLALAGCGSKAKEPEIVVQTSGSPKDRMEKIDYGMTEQEVEMGIGKPKRIEQLGADDDAVYREWQYDGFVVQFARRKKSDRYVVSAKISGERK